MKARRVRTAEHWSEWDDAHDKRVKPHWYLWWLTPGTPNSWEIPDVIISMAYSEDAIGNPYGRIP